MRGPGDGDRDPVLDLGGAGGVVDGAGVYLGVAPSVTAVTLLAAPQSPAVQVGTDPVVLWLGVGLLPVSTLIVCGVWWSVADRPRITARSEQTGGDGRRAGERGSITLWVAVMIVAFFAVVGLVVDGGGAIRATQEADAIAREAARAAGQSLTSSAQAAGNKTVTLNTAAALSEAQQHLAAAGATGSVSIEGATISVTATTTYQPMLLTALGPMTVTGTATARTAKVFEGEEQ